MKRETIFKTLMCAWFVGFVQLPLTSGAPPASECDAASEYGRQKVDASNLRLYICTAAGWKFTTLQ